MPQNSRLDKSRWYSLMDVFGMPKNDETYYQLIAAYSEKHRAYHTLEHITACFRHLDEVIAETERPHEIELALWFHDVIYKPFSATNEEDSAEMARAFLIKNEAAIDVVERVYDLIILTKDHLPPSSIDGQFMLDIDLSILGASAPIYAQFEKDVRCEYRRVPWFLFKKKRKDILQRFLSRPNIYQTDYFSSRLEKQARTNLSWAIEQL